MTLGRIAKRSKAAEGGGTAREASEDGVEMADMVELQQLRQAPSSPLRFYLLLEMGLRS